MVLTPNAKRKKKEQVPTPTPTPTPPPVVPTGGSSFPKPPKPPIDPAALPPTLRPREGFDIATGGLDAVPPQQSFVGGVGSAPHPTPETQPESLFTDQEGRTSGITIGGKTFFGNFSEDELNVLRSQFGEDEEQIKAREGIEAEQRGLAFQEETGSGNLAADLLGKIRDQPNLEPKAFRHLIFGGEPATDESLQELIVKLRAGGGSDKEIGDVLKTLGRGALLGTAIGAAIVAVPYLATSLVGASTTATMAGKLKILSGSIGGIAALAGGGKLGLDWDSGEMNTQRKIIGGYVEDGEKLKAIVTAGGDPGTMIELITQASAEIDEAERVLKEAGNLNFQNRIAKEYQDDMNNIRTARLALLRRVEEINRIAESGTSTVDPEKMMYYAAQLNDDNE